MNTIYKFYDKNKLILQYICIILSFYFIGSKNCINILVFSLILLIIYYININMSSKIENFEINTKFYANGQPQTNNRPKYLTYCEDTPAQPIYGYSDMSVNKTKDNGINSNNSNLSVNQRLVGEANPKTRIQPVIISPISDLDFWKSNDLTVLSTINKQSQRELYQNGYVSTSKCGKTCNSNDDSYNNYTKRFADYKPLSKQNDIVNNNDENKIKQIERINKIQNYNEDIKENFIEFKPEYGELIGENVNLACGYNAKNLDVNLHSNTKVSECAKDPIFTEHNRNIYTQNVGEYMYDVNQVNEPINSLMGITLQQPFEPVTYSINEYGEKIFTEHDPNMFKQKKIVTKLEPVRTDNVYDPRSYGYGTSYRAYQHELLGQTRFMYDDINSVRMPNYITRSNIDHNSFADTYGPMRENEEFGSKYNSDIRSMANKAFIDDTTQFREEMSQRLMRKRNSELWQTRKYQKGPYRK